MDKLIKKLTGIAAGHSGDHFCFRECVASREQIKHAVEEYITDLAQKEN